MSKITFRADEELVERIETRDASKSEIMREALREYLDVADRESGATAERERTAAPDRERPAFRGANSGGARGERRRGGSLDDLLAERVDELVSERLAAWEARERDRNRVGERAQDVNVNVTLETDSAVQSDDASADRRVRSSDESSDDRVPERSAESDADTSSDGHGARDDHDAPTETESSCGQCGETLSDDHVYCPNCGEKAARRVFCECGDEVRSDWGFCPSCGRRTPAADVLDQT